MQARSNKSHGTALLFLLTLLGVFSAALARADAPTYSVSLDGGSASPDPICAGMAASATISGNLEVNGANQEYQESGDQWSWSASVTGYAPNKSTGFSSVPGGVTPPSVGASSGGSSTTVTASATTSTSPGYYQITVSGSDSFNVTYSDGTHPPSTSSQSQSGTTTLEITVVTLGGIQYKDPTNGWSSFSGTLYALKGTSLQLKALPIPSDASFPGGEPIWSGTTGASGAGATISATLNNISSSVSSPGTITATCGGTATGSAVVYDLTPQVTPTDTSVPNHSSTLIGVGEIVNVSYSTNPTGVTSGEIGNLNLVSSAGGTFTAGTGNSEGTGTYTAGATGGGVTFTLSITSGISSGASRTVSRVIIAPTLGYLILSDGRTFHGQNLISVGIYAYYAVNPNNVSLQYVELRETDVPASASGLLSNLNGIYHYTGTTSPDTDTPWYQLNFDAGNHEWDSNPEFDQAGFKHVITQADITNYPPNGYGAGTVAWQIPWNFQVTDTGVPNSALINDVLQQGTTDSSGNATISKGGITRTANVDSGYVGPFGNPNDPLW